MLSLPVPFFLTFIVSDFTGGHCTLVVKILKHSGLSGFKGTHLRGWICNAMQCNT